MKKIFILFMVFSFFCVQLIGCASFNGQFAKKSDMGMFTGCISGMIVGGLFLNVPGAGMGCMLGTGVGSLIGEQMDKRMWSRSEALMKYKLKDNEEKVLVEKQDVHPQNAQVSSAVKTSVQYTIIASDDKKKMNITEKRMLFNEKTGYVKLDERRILRTQGIYESIFTFVVPENISKGNYMIITTISDDTQTETILSQFTVI